ncbi:reverse transcriptase domain-containing protein, partial [Undibacterium fentianense]|uniref:reverse transcriptase domain-containing protein n=1 Tax=Undibacterium fentianense TaxID=2828728 RepID=UPI001E332BF1
MVYLDDIIVFSKTPAEHLEHLREVLALLSKAGVTLKAEKCHLFETEVEYLGHVLSPGELRVNEKNIKALRHARQPKTQTELKSFLGMCNVYRRFVRDYALIARPLTKLTSKKLPAQLPVFDEKQTAA